MSFHWPILRPPPTKPLPAIDAADREPLPEARMSRRLRLAILFGGASALWALIVLAVRAMIG